MNAKLIPGLVVLVAICLGYTFGYHRGVQNERHAWESNREGTATGRIGSTPLHREKNAQKTRSPLISANPDYYDYIHHLQFGSDGDVKLTAGAGQVIHFSAQGKYRLDLSNGTLELFGLRQMNPYGNEVPRSLPNRTNQFTIEAGVFAMLQETPFRPQPPDKEPVIVFTERYVFETDPLAFAQESAKSNLYYIIETRDLKVSECIYYRSDLREQITMADAKRKGLHLLSKAEQIAASATPNTNNSSK